MPLHIDTDLGCLITGRTYKVLSAVVKDSFIVAKCDGGRVLAFPVGCPSVIALD